MKRTGIITLLTDFGIKDFYVAAMKASILSVNEEVRIVDITHNIERGNIEEGAYTLLNVYSDFPPGTIHVAVVDPSVGGKRRQLIIQTNNYLFIGPDNGLLYPLAEKDAIKRTVEISNTEYMRLPVSDTFHGRDVFAPAAAWLSNGVDISEFGPEVMDIRVLEFEKPEYKDGKLYLKAVNIDIFGNITTNAGKDFIMSLNKKLPARIKIQSMDICCGRKYSDVKKGELVCYWNSSGMFEIAANCGSAAEILSLKRSDNIIIQF
ncbi:MAG: SAM-dependent chlorinase/fluorinase [Candidatus Aureabacteria bacterium]|nr:SAM-dependent chlorinase/fluorinase [Candidatus Auribacterota bacterium]